MWKIKYRVPGDFVVRTYNASTRSMANDVIDTLTGFFNATIVGVDDVSGNNDSKDDEGFDAFDEIVTVSEV